MALLCPNPECRFLRRHGVAASYRAGVTTCADCGAALVEHLPTSGASTAAIPGALASGGANARAPIAPTAITLGAVAACLALGMVTLPFIDTDVLAHWFGADAAARVGALTPLSLGALGIAPWVTAALLVELVAAAVPRWRPLREPAGRARLHAATSRLGVVVAVAQAYPVARWLESLNDAGAPVLTDYGLGVRAVLITTLVAGAVLVRLAAQLIDARGLGGGMSMLVALPVALGVVRVVQMMGHLVREGAGGGVLFWWLLVIAGAVGAALLVRPFSDDDQPARPVAGVLPVLWAAAALQALWSALPLFNLLPPSPDLNAVLIGVCAVPLTIGVGRLLHLRAPSFGRALKLSLAFVAALAALQWLAGSSNVAVDVVGVVVLVCVGRDLAGELAFRRLHGAIGVACGAPSLARAHELVTRLGDAGIAAHVRAAHHRALWHFFGPHLALDVLVPVMDLERARTMVTRDAPK